LCWTVRVFSRSPYRDKESCGVSLCVFRARFMPCLPETPAPSAGQLPRLRRPGTLQARKIRRANRSNTLGTSSPCCMASNHLLIPRRRDLVVPPLTAYRNHRTPRTRSPNLPPRQLRGDPAAAGHRAEINTPLKCQRLPPGRPAQLSGSTLSVQPHHL
jgi:hypothetical protein